MKRVKEKLFNVSKFEILIRFIVGCIILINVLPMIVLAENYIFSVHDGLDAGYGFIPHLVDSNIYFSPYKEMPVLGGLCVLFTNVGYNLFGILIYLFDFISAEIINRILYVLMGYYFMLKLLKVIFKDTSKYTLPILQLLSVAYVVLPITAFRGIGFATIPLLVLCFMFFYKRYKFDYRVLLMALYPFISTFSILGIFLCALWFLGIIIIWIKDKKPNINLITAFILMIIFYVLTSINMFLVALWPEPLNRSLISYSRDFWPTFKSYLLNGHYHAESFQHIIIIPVCVIGLINIIWECFNKKNDKLTKNKYISYLKLFACTSGLIVLFAFLGAAKDSGIFEYYINLILPLLNGFNWGRIVHLNRFLWYFLFATVLVSFAKNRLRQVLACLIVVAQLCLIVVTPATYNDVQTNLKYLIMEKPDNVVTFKEFYDTELFEEIKEDIDYNDEKVVAFGYHPSVLMYNTFCTLDGYASVHPMEWQNEFRKIIAPELEQNEWARDYYDNWGGRMYIFSSELDFQPTRTKEHESVSCNIDIDAFSDLGGKYILSRAEINNADTLGIEHMGTYTHDDSIYIIYVYENTYID